MSHGRLWRGHDVRGWLASEKLDGCRGYWDGNSMRSRSGRKIPIPPAWAAQLPRFHLDGEIWAGRGRFSDTVAAVVHGRWGENVAFVIFDAPQAAGTWRERIQSLSTLELPFAAPIPWRVVRDLPHLIRVFREIARAGGEGLMLQCPKTVGYLRGRSHRVLKLVSDPVDGTIYSGRQEVLRRLGRSLRFERCA